MSKIGAQLGMFPYSMCIESAFRRVFSQKERLKPKGKGQAAIYIKKNSCFRPLHAGCTGHTHYAPATGIMHGAEI
jgi:hypothetical protein